MEENNFTNDTAEKDISAEKISDNYEEVSAENTAEADIASETDGVDAQPVADTEEVTETVEANNGAVTEDSGSVSQEAKDYSAELAGYRAYRRKNTGQDEADTVKSSKKSGSKKVSDIKIGSISLYTVILAVFTLLDLFMMHLFTSKQAYNISDKILAALGFDALHFTNVTYEQICLGLGYFVAFILGGIVLLILMKILSKLFSQFTDWKIGSHCPIIALGIFAAIFIIGFAVSYFSKDAILVSNVFRWGAPALAYVGGLVFYGASKLHVGIEY